MKILLHKSDIQNQNHNIISKNSYLKWPSTEPNRYINMTHSEVTAIVSCEKFVCVFELHDFKTLIMGPAAIQAILGPK